MKKLFPILLLALILVPNVSLALGKCAGTEFMVDGGDFDIVLTNICTALVDFAMVVLVVAFIIAGIMFVISAGEPEKFKRAQRFLLYVLIGGIVMFAAGLFVNLAARLVS